MIAAEPKTAGQYQPYPEYKDSGVAWLGNTPSHWAVFHGKRLLSQRRETAKPESTQLAASQAYGVIPQSLLMEMTGNKVMLALKGTENFKHVSENDFVISLRSFEGGIEHSAYSGCVSPAYTVLQALKAIHPWFYRYLFKSSPYIAALQASTDSLRDGKSITFEQFGAISLPLPSPEEQHTIAAFLDYETARIDRLIAQQQRLIELLKEKRQAVISHAVTKGLNPSAPMKDSGVEWLGQVPKHWVVSRIKNYAKIESGHTPSRQVEEYWIDCNIPWVSLNDSKTLKVVDYISDTFYKINELGMANSSAHLLPERAVVFTRDASIGLAAITTIPMAVSQHLIAWICNEKKVIPEFLLLVFYAMELEFERYTFGATIKTIGMDDVRTLTAGFPKIDEQKEIITWAFSKLNILKNVLQKAEEKICLLQERRIALISAAVTGKIDLRGWTPPADEVVA
ncbi:restriction endonuclease subunit S [Aeromonas sp. 97A]|uniref:restriction endonuclease subunit S n=1 Tax=Aeromonas sp. 97A TaxID=3452731 RepID=UPI003F7A9121